MTPDGGFVPYSERLEWADVTRVPQDDGPEPLAVIRYPQHFEETHDYFRAVQLLDERSERVLMLTADIIKFNSANYTAWYYRRLVLKNIGADLRDELEVAGEWGMNNPKNYQVWYHRRWLITEIAVALQAEVGAEAEAQSQLLELGRSEVQYCLEVMQDNDDYKNYNGWSHRQFIVQKFGLWGEEMPAVEALIDQDICNNSAWNHRFAVVRNSDWPVTDEIRLREVLYALAKLRDCVSNESAWNYLGAFLGEGDARAPWNSVPEVGSFCAEVIAAERPERTPECRLAMETLARVDEASGNVDAACALYAQLKVIDKVRGDYWDWRQQLLRGGTAREGAAAPAKAA